jgi:energy-converting hydrogenase Eha subunit H
MKISSSTLTAFVALAFTGAITTTDAFNRPSLVALLAVAVVELINYQQQKSLIPKIRKNRSTVILLIWVNML